MNPCFRRYVEVSTCETSSEYAGKLRLSDSNLTTVVVSKKNIQFVLILLSAECLRLLTLLQMQMRSLVLIAFPRIIYIYDYVTFCNARSLHKMKLKNEL